MWEMVVAGALTVSMGLTIDDRRSTIDVGQDVTIDDGRSTRGVGSQRDTLDLAINVDRRSSNVDRDSRSPALTTMYITFGALQVADIHSTTRALANGGVEANPAMRGIVGNRAAFIAVKAAGGAATIFAAEKLRKKHPVAAFVLMASLNTVMATVVAHNYRID